MKLGATRVTTAAVSRVFAKDGGIGTDDTQGARGGDAQTVHGFAAEKLPDAAAQHRAAIAHAREGCQSGALELHFMPRRFSEQQGPAVTQLSGPDAKLVAAVDTGQWCGAGNLAVARYGQQQRVRFHLG